MKNKQELKKFIKEEILSSLNEKKKKETDDEVETTTDTETETSAEETPSEDFGVDPKIQTLQNALKAAYDAAKGMGDEKLETQIGNTITYFTRTHVVKKNEPVSENLTNKVIEAVFKRLKKS